MKRITLFLAAAFLAVSPLWADSPANLYKGGTSAFEQKYYKIAVKYFQELREEFPDFSRAHEAAYYEGVAYFYLKDFSRVIQLFQGFDRDFPGSPYGEKIHYWVGAAYFYLGSYKESGDSFAKQHEKFGSHFSLLTLYLGGVSFHKTGEYARTVDFLKKLLELPGARRYEEKALFLLGSSDMALKRYKQAVFWYKKLLVDHYQSKLASDATYYLGECYFFLNERDQAVKIFRDLYALVPHYKYAGKVLFRLVQLLSEKEAYGEAEKYLLLLEKEGGGLEVLPFKGAVYFNLKDYPKALEAYKTLAETLSVKEQRLAALYNLSLCYLNLKEKKKALPHLKELITSDDAGYVKKALLKLSETYMDLKQYDEATGVLEEYKRRFYRTLGIEEVLRGLALCYSKTGKSLKGLKVLNQLIKEYTTSPYRDEYLFRRAVIHITEKSYKDALGDFSRVIKLFPGSVYSLESWYYSGYVYSVRGEFKRALEYYDYVIARETREKLLEQSRIARGICFFNLDNLKEADAVFERTIRRTGAGYNKGLANYYRGMTLSRLDKLEGALKCFVSARAYLAESEEAPEVLYLKGWTEFRLNRLIESKDSFLELIKEYPQSSRVNESYYRAGMCLALLDNPEESTELLERLLTRDNVPGLLKSESYHRLALNLIDTGNPEKGYAYLLQLNREFPDSPLGEEIFAKAASELYKKGAFREALTALEEIFSQYKEPGSELYFFAGRSALETGESGKSRNYFLDYLKRDSRETYLYEAIMGIKESLTGKDEAGEVSAFFDRTMKDKSLSFDLKNIIRYEYAAWVFSSDPEESFELLESIRKSRVDEPLKSSVNLLIGRCYMERGDYDSAYYVFKGIAEANSGEPGALAVLYTGDSLLAQGREEAAFEEYLKTSFLFPDYKEHQAHGLYKAYIIAEKNDRREKDKIYSQLEKDFGESVYFKRIQK